MTISKFAGHIRSKKLKFSDCLKFGLESGNFQKFKTLLSKSFGGNCARLTAVCLSLRLNLLLFVFEARKLIIVWLKLIMSFPMWHLKINFDWYNRDKNRNERPGHAYRSNSSVAVKSLSELLQNSVFKERCFNRYLDLNVWPNSSE